MLGKILRQIAEHLFPGTRVDTLGMRVKPIGGGMRPASVAVVITTICRNSLLRAVRSIFSQDIEEPVQILIGVDQDRFGQAKAIRKTLLRECPSHMELVWFDPGYSTSQRNGGVHRCFFGGSMRTLLSFLANAQIIAYLDDDDWYAPDHLRKIMSAIKEKYWAYSLCYYADSENEKALAVDEIESVGVGAGIYAEKFGGFVRPSALAIDKLRLAHVLHLWSEALGPMGDGEDRLIFARLKDLPHGITNTPTVYYALDPKDVQHSIRMSFIRSKIGHQEISDRIDSSRA